MSAGPIWDTMVQTAANNLLHNLGPMIEFIGIVLLFGTVALTAQALWRRATAP